MEVPDTSFEVNFLVGGVTGRGSVIEVEGRLWLISTATRLPECRLRLEALQELDRSLLRRIPNGSASFYSYQGILDHSKTICIPPEASSLPPA